MTVRKSWLRRWRGRTVQGARAVRLEICLAHAFSLPSSRLGLKCFRLLSTNYRGSKLRATIDSRLSREWLN